MGERWKSKERKLKTDEYVEKLLASQKSIKTFKKIMRETCVSSKVYRQTDRKITIMKT